MYGVASFVGLARFCKRGTVQCALLPPSFGVRMRGLESSQKKCERINLAWSQHLVMIV